MKTIMLIIAALALAACNKDQTPQQSVEQFKEAQSPSRRPQMPPSRTSKRSLIK